MRLPLRRHRTDRAALGHQLRLGARDRHLALVLLPIIIVGQNIQAAAADARAEATYKDAAAVLEEAKQIQLHLQAQDERIADILRHLETLVSSGPTTP